jgi:glycosyltransferase involved in cell wall biosynthesis
MIAAFVRTFNMEKQVHICLDIQSAIAQRAGIGRYTRMLAIHLSELRGTDEISGFYFDFRRRADTNLPAGLRARAVRWLPGQLVQQAWKRLGWPPFDSLAGPADVYHFPNFIVPPLRRGRAVVTIHDLSFIRHPDCAETRNLAYLRARLTRTVARADAIITDSNFCAAEMEEMLPECRGKVTAVPLGIGSEFAEPSADVVITERLLRGLERPYILSVGTLEPRKNYTFLIEVFERLGGFDGDLVIVGRPGWKYEAILERMRNSPRAARIRWLADAADGELPLLYAGAELMLFPSLYEGFGFPPLEAMACGTPVVASAGGSLPEVLGDGARIIPEFDSEAWSAAVSNLLDDRKLRMELVARGRVRAAQYTWHETARRTWDVYRGVVA